MAILLSGKSILLCNSAYEVDFPGTERDPSRVRAELEQSRSSHTQLARFVPEESHIIHNNNVLLPIKANTNHRHGLHNSIRY